MALLHNKCSDLGCRRGVLARVSPGINEVRAIRHRAYSQAKQQNPDFLGKAVLKSERGAPQNPTLLYFWGALSVLYFQRVQDAHHKSQERRKNHHRRRYRDHNSRSRPQPRPVRNQST